MEEISALDIVLRTALGLGITQWMAFFFSIVYVILAANENIWCWPFGIISVILAFIVYIDPEVRLYSDAVLQVFYVVMSIYGWWNWRQSRDQKFESSEVDDLEANASGALRITQWSTQKHLIAFGIGVGLALVAGWAWTLTGAALPFIDAFTTAFSIIATIMVAQKVLENWLYWIVIDFACIFIYAHRGIYLFSLLFFIYMVIAVFGYLSWKKKYTEQQMVNG